MKAIEFIEQESFVVVNPDYPVISKDNALKAVEMAKQEMKEKAIEAFTERLDCMGCDKDQIEVYVEELKKKLEE